MGIVDTNSTAPPTNNANNNAHSTNIYIQGFYGIMLPIFIWSMCFIRAWQFQTLIAEAEVEMQNRFDEILGQQQQQQQDESDTAANPIINDDLTLQSDDHSIV